MTMKCLIVITLYYTKDGWIIGVIDIETAFLEANLKEEVWIICPWRN